ncbi:hypothetical protein [Legionella sp. PL877]|uniref:hypothetical protein n=1 Tax=Legionella sp. PL877 TaxID=3046773 RepID=UPI00351BF04B
MFILLAIFWIPVANAETTIPASCKPVRVQNETVVLSAEKPLLIMIHNLSKSDLWITHPVSEPGASAGWSSRLKAGNWSALALDKASFELSCIESKPGHEQQIPCAGAISVCRWTVTMPAQTAGTFWAGEDMGLPALIEHLGGRGFELPDTSQ